MKLNKLLIVIVILIFAIGNVTTLVARDKAGDVIITNPPPDTDPGGEVIEGDPWDDNEDDGPGNTMIFPGIKIGGKLLHFSILKFWFTNIRTNSIKIEQPRIERISNAPRKLTK